MHTHTFFLVVLTMAPIGDPPLFCVPVHRSEPASQLTQPPEPAFLQEVLTFQAPCCPCSNNSTCQTKRLCPCCRANTSCTSCAPYRKARCSRPFNAQRMHREHNTRHGVPTVTTAQPQAPDHRGSVADTSTENGGGTSNPSFATQPLPGSLARPHPRVAAATATTALAGPSTGTEAPPSSKREMLISEV